MYKVLFVVGNMPLMFVLRHACIMKLILLEDVYEVAVPI